MKRFMNRFDAGKQLAQALLDYKLENPYILALPRGGVVLGYEIAKALQAPLDIMVVRKLGAPNWPELAIGAISSFGKPVLNEDVIRSLQITPDDIAAVVAKEIDELNRRVKLYRGHSDFPSLTDRTVILVDDGIATGATARSAIEALKTLQPKHIVLAVPVGHPDTIEEIRQTIDNVVCLQKPYQFSHVGKWYKQFAEVSDETVLQLLSSTHPVSTRHT